MKTAAALASALLLATGSRADVPHEAGRDAKAWGAYLEYALTGDETALQRLTDISGETSFVALEQAMTAGRRGDRARMIERAQRAVELDPSNGEAHALLARAWFRMGDEGLASADATARAVEHASEAVRLGAADAEIFDRLADAHAALASRAERAGDAEGALKERTQQRDTLRTWAERLHQDAAWRQLADLERELGDMPGEARALENDLRRGDDVLLAAQRLGDVLSELDRCEAAIPMLDQALDAAGADKYAAISLAVQLGDCAARVEEPAIAERAFRRALELDPTNLIALAGLAEAAWQQGRRDEARQVIDGGGDRGAGDDAALHGDASQRLDWLATRARWKAAHDLPDALDDARKALALAESTGTPRQRALMGALVAEAHLSRGETAAAVAAARAATVQDASQESALVTLLNAVWSAGDRRAVADEIAGLEKKSQGASWFARVARWEAARGFDEAARRHVKRALDALPGAAGARAPVQAELGAALLMTGDAAGAERLAREALRARPWDEDAAFLLAEALTAQGHSEAGEDAIAAFVASRGEDPWLFERWSRMEAARRRKDLAIERATRALHLAGEGAHPVERARFVELLATLLADSGRNAEAVALLQPVLDRGAPASPSRVLLMSRALDELGRTADALALVEGSLAVRHDEPSLAQERGRLLLALGRTREGADQLLGTLADPRALPGRFGQVALALAKAQQTDAALDVAARAIERFPRHAGALLAAARVSEQAGRRDEAEARFRRALELDPDAPAVLNALGYSLADWGTDLDEAVRLLRRAVELHPNEAAYLDSLGWALHRTGRQDEASRLLESALARDRDPVILAHLAAVRESQGRRAEAVELLREALASGLDEGVAHARAALQRLQARTAGP